MACGGSKSGTPSPPSGGSGGSGGPNDPIAITGTESIGWDQEATSASDAAGLRYLIYVDANPNTVTDVQCSGSGPFACRTRLPQMAAGVHRLEISAAKLVDGSYLESPKSPQIMVQVAARIAAPSSDTSAAASASSAAPTGCASIAIAGRTADVIVADTGGIRRLQPGAESAATVLLDNPSDSAILSVAVAPTFADTHLVFALAISGSDDAGYRLQIARYREAGGTLGERAVLMDRAAAGAYRFGRLRFDGTGRLYAGAWGSARGLQPRGVLLRLTEDARAADDTRGRSGLVEGAESLRGFDVEPASGRLWIVQEAAANAFVLRAVAADGAEQIEVVPLGGAPAQIAVRAAPSGAAGQIWSAYTERLPVVVRRDARGTLTAAALPKSVDEPWGDVAFAANGALLACTSADIGARGSGSRVLRIDPALSRAAGRP